MKAEYAIFFIFFLIVANATFSHTYAVQTDILPPKKQVMQGVSLDMIVCASGLELVMKKSNGMPACVKPTSVATLIERGWAIHVLPDYNKEKPKNSDVFSLGSYDVTTSNIRYNDSTGFLAKPTDGNFPGVIMIHEWWGLNENIKSMAENLASHGYIVLAVDLFDDVATTADEARSLVTSYEKTTGITNMKSATNYLEENYEVDRIASVGWCFGGGQSLNLALNQDMDTTVIYYGQLVTDSQQLSTINWPVLGIFAELDNGIPVSMVNQFESTLDDLGVQNEIYIYDGVDHAFANPSGMRYAPDETKNAWEKTISFLETNLK